MRKQKIVLWAWVLLAAVCFWSAAPAFAGTDVKTAKDAKIEKSVKQRVNPNANQGSNKNPNQLRRELAMEELAAAVAARIQVDPHFAAYVAAVNQRDREMAEWVKAKKAEQGGGK